MRRHPSFNRTIRPAGCTRCGFQPPPRDRLPAAIAAIPDQWADAVHGDDTLLEAAARLRDELHVVANRVGRVLTAPGSALLATVVVDAPSALSRSADADQLVALLRPAARRLAGLTASLQTSDWLLFGRVGARPVSIEELVLMALHRNHAGLTRRGTTCR